MMLCPASTGHDLRLGRLAVVGAVLLPLLLAGACKGGGQAPPPKGPATAPGDAAAAPTSGRVTIVCEPSAAEVIADGERQGTAAEIEQRGGLALPFGVHRIEIRLDGHSTFRLELNLGQQPEVIRVKLQPRP